MQAWQDFWVQPHWHQSLWLTLWTGLASTALSWWICRGLIKQLISGKPSARLHWLQRAIPSMLAVPHAAFAIGLIWLIAPSGWLLRLVSPWLTGFDWPPPWPTTQDPWGLGLIAALVFKEVPFLLWTAATQWQRPDVVKRWQQELHLAQTLGYTPSRSFDLIIWPQLAHRLRWPLLAVLAYSLTVVDVAHIAAPNAPPPLAVQAWQWLQDADVAVNSQGMAAALLLTALVLALSFAVWWGVAWRAKRLVRGVDGRRATLVERFEPLHNLQRWVVELAAISLLLMYALVAWALMMGSVTGVWTFPSLWPQEWSLQAWQNVWQSRGTLANTLTLAVCSSVISLAVAVLWLEASHPRWQQRLQALAYLPLIVPSLLWVLLLYFGALRLGLSASWWAVCVGHIVLVLPYVLIALSPAYVGFDVRYAQVVASLGQGRWRFLSRVKWPLLKSSLVNSLAVGFAVSVVQYLPTLYLGGGRIGTVTTEAVALASSGQRSLTSSYALLQFVLPVMVFALAHRLGQPRRFATPASS